MWQWVTLYNAVIFEHSWLQLVCAGFRAIQRVLSLQAVLQSIHQWILLSFQDLPHVLTAEILTFCKNIKSVNITTTVIFNISTSPLYPFKPWCQNQVPSSLCKRQGIYMAASYFSNFGWWYQVMLVFSASHCTNLSHLSTPKD
jgi:hypothetical protein